MVLFRIIALFAQMEKWARVVKASGAKAD